jgi:purine nucleoside phosphorylase
MMPRAVAPTGLLGIGREIGLSLERIVAGAAGTPTLDAFDPELRDAAREAARRAGLSVDEWLAEAIGRPDGSPRDRPGDRPEPGTHRCGCGGNPRPHGVGAEPAMRRTAPTLDAFDPELRDAAREAARRAGLSGLSLERIVAGAAGTRGRTAWLLTHPGSGRPLADRPCAEPAMRRTAPTLDAFDPELRDAAREAARRAGLAGRNPAPCSIVKIRSAAAA